MPLTDLAPVSTATGPFASAYLDTTHTTPDADTLIDGRWRAQRARLAEQGADEATLAAMDEVVGFDPQHPGPQGQAVVAAGGRVLLVEHLPAPPRREVARWSTVPHLMPLVVQRASVVPHVVVVADRIGAEVTAYGPGGEAHEEVEGSDLYIRKVQAGGWSQRRYQDTAEEMWKHNADQVAQRVDALVKETGARLVVAAGDTRALVALEEHLGEAAKAVLVRVEEGGRAEGADREGLQRHVERLVAEVAAREELALLDRFREQRGQMSRAVEGLAGVVEAARKAQIDTVLLVDRPDSTATLWAGAEPLALGTSAEEVRALGVDEPFEDRADALLVRALAGSDASLVVVPGEEEPLLDGIGAVLRYADASTSRT
ncbi:MAG: baeRF2 domain-containing protein [Motilibacteraceae bacterium]